MKISPKKVHELSNCIWIQYNFGEFQPLETISGTLFYSLTYAKEYVRTYIKVDAYVGLATFEQALMGNAEWDNI